MKSRHHDQEENDWLDIPLESSFRRSKKEEKRKRKLWEEEDFEPGLDSWDDDDPDQY